MLGGWLVCGVFSLVNGAVIAEICAVYPVAGGIYYWAGALSRKKSAHQWSYFTGWLYFTSYVAGLSSFCNGLANILLSFIYPQSASEHLKVLLSIVLLAVWCLQNSYPIET